MRKKLGKLCLKNNVNFNGKNLRYHFKINGNWGRDENLFVIKKIWKSTIKMTSLLITLFPKQHKKNHKNLNLILKMNLWIKKHNV